MFEQDWKYLTEHKAVRTISLDNSLVHQGRGFSHHNHHTLATASTLNYLIITPPTIDIHFRAWSVKSDQGPVTIYVFEDTVTSASGTPEPVGNNNRQSNITNQLTMFTTPTITSDGNQMLKDYIGITGGGAHVTVGESASDDTEWLLKRNTKYMFRVVNTSGATANLVHTFNWFEI